MVIGGPESVNTHKHALSMFSSQRLIPVCVYIQVHVPCALLNLRRLLKGLSKRHFPIVQSVQ